MHKKIVVIGGVAGGASAAARVKRLDAQAHVVILERGEHVSFSNCCLPYYLGGTIRRIEDLVLMTPEKFKAQYDIDVRTHSEAVAIDRALKKVQVRNTLTGECYDEEYDKLILSPGAEPIRPSRIRGIAKDHVFTIRNLYDLQQISDYLREREIQKVTVVGGGFIGLEAAENLCLAGKEVTLVEGAAQILSPFDYDMVQSLHKELVDHGVHLMVSASVTEIQDDCVSVTQGGAQTTIPAQAVILAIGIKPEISLAEQAGLRIGETGGIWVNPSHQTSDPDIYAVGDAAEAYDSLARRPGRLALAGPAQRQARAAADHIYGARDVNRGFIGSCCIRLFEQNAACTGLNEARAKCANIPYDFVYLLPPDKVGLMPDSHYMAFKLLFEVPTGRILGAQAIGRGNVDKRIDVIAAMISMGATLAELKELELCYSPVFGTPKDIVNMAALVGLNILAGQYRQIPVGKVRELVESGAYIVDVREQSEYDAGHLLGAHNIPLSQLHQRMGEIPRDIPVYMHCRTGQRSYYAVSILQGHGYTNVANISGSFLGISLYEYYNDLEQDRKPILTKYNFT